ncbi:unnamed protein product [Arctia plantaginis]|uniref:Uncharacterized protein n=1 Tax=Arctia plantaginis TaxID=874455 RepID=A0A8S1APW0_ARCPL|nr:unnamed protein product [Arctia plantaginis]CAB3255071.1 unnamed protein product [Arctia plantaginis]
MEVCQQNVLPQCNIVIHADTREAENFRPMTCPLCKSVLKLYQIHFDEKFLMCGNVECVYPIGITDYHIYKIDCSEEVVRNSAGCSSVTSESTLSYAEWIELEKTMQNDSLLSPSCTPPPSLTEKPKEMEKLAKIKEQMKAEDRIRRNVKEIQELNKELTYDGYDSIDSEKWIKHIAKMEERSGVQLLKEDELKRVRKPHSAKELKIDLDTSGEVISLKIDVLNKNKQV